VKSQGVWVLDGQKPRRAPLTLGISDGNETAVLFGELKEGDEVIIETMGQAKKGASQAGRGSSDGSGEEERPHGGFGGHWDG